MSIAAVDYPHCPLCGDSHAVPDSEPSPNLYSEKLALLLDRDERSLLREHANWRCTRCGLLYKRRWFADSALRDLFTGAVAVHPRGWDCALNRFSDPGFRSTVDRWVAAVESEDAANIRRGQRELVSIIESITEPRGFQPDTVTAAIMNGHIVQVLTAMDSVAASIMTPAPFKRFAGFRSRELWAYLQGTLGGLATYAEVGCPLWGLLTVAADNDVPATFLQRDETNYWGRRCIRDGQRCTSRLLLDERIAAAEWAAQRRYSAIGVFQYLDHPSDPHRFLEEVFARARSAAIIVDSANSPPAIQHLTAWNESSMAYVAERFGKRLHTDYSAIRLSGNVLYVLSGGLET